MSGDEPQALARDLPCPTSFQTAINMSTAGSIHLDTGRAVVIGESIYYSPNSSRTPPMPPPVSRSYIRDPSKDAVEEFHDPRWWSVETGYLPFLPIAPNLNSPPFHLLFNTPVDVGPRRKCLVQMDSQDVLNWNRLENTLARLFKSFQASYSIPTMSPIICTSLACQRVFDYPSQYMTAEKRCRNWFAMWMAMNSLGIAIADISESTQEVDMIPKWYHDFSKHTEEPILSEIRQQLGQFTLSYPRAGVFLDLHSSQEQPTIDFFVRLGIPVWYAWGSKEESCALKNPSFWMRYTPPAHLLQQAHSFLTAAPGPAPPLEDEDDQPWIAFFQERQRRATNPMPKKKPARKVFHWERDSSSGKWTRTPVIRRLHEETLAEYGKRQKFYDERTNEWDVSTQMGDKDAEELQADFWAESPDESVLSLEPRPVSTNVVTSVDVDPTHKVDDTRREDYHPDVHSPADILRLFFSFVSPPIFVRLVLPPVTEQQIKDFALGTGFASSDIIKDYAQTPVHLLLSLLNIKQCLLAHKCDASSP